MTTPQVTDNKVPGYVGATSRFKPTNTTIDLEGFIVVEGIWINDERKEENAFAMRWYSDGIGYPNGRGYPQWMVVPNFMGWCIKMGIMIKKIAS